ncbi:MAG: RDD family protein, partial [Geminicoccales bacterium]
MATVARLHALLGETDERSRRTIVTPEGVALPVELAGRSERAAAFLIDLSIITGCFIGLILLAWLAGLTEGGPGEGQGIAVWVWIILLLVWFLVRSFYFALFELRWQGSTPGKRVFHLRVTDRSGGALTADAVIARNLMREVEVFLPFSLIIVGIATEMHGLLQLAMLGWMLILTFMPLFNRDRLRVGDMVGGTWVIVAPKAT